MHRLALTKADGRKLWLYSREAIDSTIQATTPQSDSAPRNPHLRWHRLRGEWVAYASYRQNRVFLPPPEYNPLGVTRSASFPTEVPPGRYDIAVFENLSPSLTMKAHSPPESIVPTEPGLGACEVVVFSQDPTTSLGKLPLSQIELLFSVWADRYLDLGANEAIRYVMPFENRGVEVGVTLHHPHGQIYAYPFVPPTPARELEQQRRFYSQAGKTLLADIVEKELADAKRILYSGPRAVAFLPAFARYPYEVWITTKKAVPSLAACEAGDLADLARALKTTLLKYDALWNRPFPYLMAVHQAPTDGEPHPESHLRFEFSPPLRTENRLKYLAGTELAAGMFVNDALPESKAEELQRIEVSLE